MYKSYIISAIRFFQRNKIYSSINLFGLALGLAAFSLIFQYVLQELSFDRFHENSEWIYRIHVLDRDENGEELAQEITSGVGASLLEEFPEVDAMCRVKPEHSEFIRFGEKNIKVKDYAFADSSFFRMFCFPLIEGDAASCLREAFSMVLSESLAAKVFPDGGPIIGKSIKLNNKESFLITGIMKDPPKNSHLQPEAIASFESLNSMHRCMLDWNGGWAFLTYVMLHPKANITSMEARFDEFMERHINNQYREYGIELFLKPLPLKKIHLHSYTKGGQTDRSDYKKIILMSLIALSILLLAMINFTNLSIALFSKRRKEAGIRKVVGAENASLIRQHLLESVVMAVLAFPLALIIGEVFHTQINSLSGLNIGLYGPQAGLSLLVSFFIALLAGLFGGIYPARFIASTNPLIALKGNQGASGNPFFRNALVVFQFFIAATLISSTIIMHRQMDYVEKFDTGFNGNHLYIIPLQSEKARMGNLALCRQIENISGVLSAGSSSEVPGRGFTRNGYTPEGFKNPKLMHVLFARMDYLQTLGLHLVEGEMFTNLSDKKSIIINQSTANSLGWDQPIGKKIARNGEMTVVGMIRDFHFGSAHQKIGPLIICPVPEYNGDMGYNYISLRYEGDPIIMRKQLESLWARQLPEDLFEIHTQKEMQIEAYAEEKKQGRLIDLFSALGIFIAAIGLFGLATFIGSLRQKEAALRQVLGASSWRIHLLFIRQFIVWVLFANILSVPFVWFFMSSWLSHYEYRIALGFQYFLYSLLLSMMIALVSIMHQTWRASKANPANMLKYE